MPTEDELARLRIEEEAKKIISTTSRIRKLKQRELIGEEAEEIDRRIDHVEDAKRLWNAKGTEGQTHGADTIEQNVATKAKQTYEENLKKFSEKGKTEPQVAGEIPVDLKKKFDKPTTVPTLFTKTSIKQPKDAAPPSNSVMYSDGFAKIEKQEIKMVGDAKHITTTGIDQAGRRVTKTKIILPEQVGETKAQHQQGVSKNPAEGNNKLMPTSWDGKYYSLKDIRQRKVEGIDLNNREQYLSPEEFEQAFKMSKEAFSNLPKWKRDKLKQELHLHWAFVPICGRS